MRLQTSVIPAKRAPLASVVSRREEQEVGGLANSRRGGMKDRNVFWPGMTERCRGAFVSGSLRARDQRPVVGVFRRGREAVLLGRSRARMNGTMILIFSFCNRCCDSWRLAEVQGNRTNDRCSSSLNGPSNDSFFLFFSFNSPFLFPETTFLTH